MRVWNLIYSIHINADNFKTYFGFTFDSSRIQERLISGFAVANLLISLPPIRDIRLRFQLVRLSTPAGDWVASKGEIGDTVRPSVAAMSAAVSF